jgi:hypothetical protein
MQDFWDEMVINMDKSRQGGLFSLFGDSSEGTYARFWVQIQTLLSRMQSSRFVGGFLSPDRWFSWRIAIAFFALAASLLVVYKGLMKFFPNLVPKSLRGKSAVLRRTYSKIEFYEKLIKLLRSLGLRRQPHQTPQEFLWAAGDALKRADLSLDMEQLSSLFYAKRFGQSETLDPDQAACISANLKSLDEAIRGGLKNKIKALSPTL